MTKLDVLKATVYNLENDVYAYSWSDSDSCNCGILARTIMNGATPIKEGGLWDRITKRNEHCLSFILGSPRGFSGAVEQSIQMCHITRLPYPRVIKALLDYDFTVEELKALEFFGTVSKTEKRWFNMEDRTRGEKIIGSKLNLEGMVRNDKQDVIKYLKAWIEVLEEKEMANAVVEEEVGELTY